jgi:hypothetical protein
MRPARFLTAILGLAVAATALGQAPRTDKPEVDASTLARKITCGYQGWFRCPEDGAKEGWVHWSRDSKKVKPKSLTFEMWPDLGGFPEKEKFAAPGFTHPDGSQAYLFSSDNEATVLRHFEWMRDYGIDGAWLQHFLVDLPGGPAQSRYPSRRRVMEHVRKAAKATGRVWALAYDIAGMPHERIYDTLTADWKRMVDEKITKDPRYLHEGGKPVVQIWGFFRRSAGNAITPELANRLIDFFKTDGPYAAYFVGGGDWNWRGNKDRDWRAFYDRFDAYMPWNVGNYATDAAGVKRASTGYWTGDMKTCKETKVRWIPVVYPGFGWDNLMRKEPGTTTIPRRKGEFLWEQFHALAKLGADSAYVAMFDEVDEGTAIFKVTSTPPTQAHFLGYEGLPSDWYLRLVGEGGRMLRGERAVVAEIPIRP